MSALKFLRKAVRVRRQLMRSGKSYQDARDLENALQPLERWLKFWNGKATDQGALVIIKKHEVDVRSIIPGGESRLGMSMRQELNSLINQTPIMKQFNFSHSNVQYRAIYAVDETNQRVDLKAIQLATDKTNIMGIVSSRIIDSLRARLESEHLTHAA